MAVLYLDFEGGNDANNGTTFALRVKTVTGGITAARSAPGDIVRVMGSPDPTSLGSNVTWTNKSSALTLAAAKNVLITNCDTVFVASANVTCTADATYFRTGTASSSSSIAAGFTTGLVSYFDLGAAQDYSAYQGITLWVMVRTAALAAATLSIRLCSDAVGAVTVNTLTLPAIAIVDCWVPVYVNNGAALGAAIRSIALYADLDPGTVIVHLDNISTVKAAGADALHLRSLISKNTANELWWCLREINGTALAIDGTPYNLFGTNQRVGRGYWGTTETVLTYIRETIVAAQTTGTFAAVQEAGTSGNLISYLGGWNRTDMTTQTLETWVDGSGGYGRFWDTNNCDFIHVDKINGVRWDDGLYHNPGATAFGCTFGTMKMGHCRGIGIRFHSGGSASGTELTGYGTANVGLYIFNPDRLNVTTLRSISAGLSGAVTHGAISFAVVRSLITTLEVRNAAWHGLDSEAGGYVAHSTITNLTVSDCGQTGIFPPINCYHTKIGTIVSTSNGGWGLRIGAVFGRLIIMAATLQNNPSGGLDGNTNINAHVTIGTLTTSGNGMGVSLGAMHGVLEVLNSALTDTTPVAASSASSVSNPYGRATFRKYLGTVDDHRSWVGGYAGHGTLVSELTVRHTASGLAWKLSPTNTLITDLMPLRVALATIYVKASALVTVKVWLRRTNTGLTGSLFCRGGQLSGVASDLTSSISAAINTWQEVTITCTPTEAGALEFEIHTYATDTVSSLYFDDFSAAQA